MNEWLESISQEKIIRLDITQENINYTDSVPFILEKIFP
jgi:hypothetical protein